MERKGSEENASGFVKAKGPPQVVHGQRALERPGNLYVLLRPKLLKALSGKKRESLCKTNSLLLKKSNENYNVILIGEKM